VKFNQVYSMSLFDINHYLVKEYKSQRDSAGNLGLVLMAVMAMMMMTYNVDGGSSCILMVDTGVIGELLKHGWWYCCSSSFCCFDSSSSIASLGGFS